MTMLGEPLALTAAWARFSSSLGVWFLQSSQEVFPAGKSPHPLYHKCIWTASGEHTGAGMQVERDGLIPALDRLSKGLPKALAVVGNVAAGSSEQPHGLEEWPGAAWRQGDAAPLLMAQAYFRFPALQW